jgi:hypothetical protein
MPDRERQAELIGAAVAYAGRGLPVFPCKGKVPLTEHGFQDASTDTETVLAWWTRWPEASIGIPTGGVSGLVVLDVDVQHGGAGTLAELERKHGKLPAAPEVLTGGGGKHLYFAHPGQEVRNSAGKLGPGLDIRADGGYVITPPSTHDNGRVYCWLRSGEMLELQEPPAWLLENAEKRQNGAASPVERFIPEGQRRRELLSLAGSMRRRGMNAGEILPALAAVNDARCQPPLAQTELERLVDDVGDRYEPAVALGKPAYTGPPPELEVVSLDAFTNVEEPGAKALVGELDDALIPENGDVMLYGDGGAGKTTLGVDLGFHLAAGDDWLGIRVPRAVRVLLVENEGPRPLFRAKLRRKREGWSGSELGERLSVLEKPWGQFSFAEASWREAIAAKISEHEVDVVILGPVTRLGMNEAGTLQEVRDFMALVDEVRAQAERGVVVVLIHHENKGGQVSGAWEGAGDTLFHVQAQGHGSIRLHVQKARWSSNWHKKTLQLTWAEGEGFNVEEKEELDDETLAEQILAAIRHDPGKGWARIEEATPGVNRQRRMAVRDGLLSRGQIVNVGKDVDGEPLALAHCPERRPARLYPVDDPTIGHLLPASGADGEQIAPAGAAGGSLHLLPAPRPIGEQGVGADVLPPPDEVEP